MTFIINNILIVYSLASSHFCGIHSVILLAPSDIWLVEPIKRLKHSGLEARS